MPDTDDHEPESRRPDPHRKLQQLTGELNRKQAEIKTLNQQTTDLQADITDLNTTVAEVSSILASYGDSVTKLRKDREDLEYFLEQKTKMVAPTVHDKKDAIDRLIRDYDAVLHAHGAKVAQLGERSLEAQEQAALSAAIVQKKQQGYDSAKQVQKVTTDHITELKALKDQIVAADNKQDVASMYFLTLEMRRLMHHTEIASQGRLADELNNALSQLEEAKEENRARNAARDALQVEHGAEKKKFDDMKANRRKDILAAIQAAWPPPSQDSTPATPATGTAPSSTPAASGTTTPASTTTPPASK
jgi:chromosome segregation ATPase